MADGKLTLGYWSAPGKAQATRYVLELAGLEYNDVRYTNPADWFGRDKLALGLEFPNLPYIIDGDVKLTESEALFEYAANKTGQTELLGKEGDRYTVILLRNLISDLGTRLYFSTIASTPEEKTKILTEQVLPKLKFVHAKLANKDWILGYLSAADIYLISIAKGFSKLAPEQYTELAGSFDALIARFEAIPKIAAYI